MQFNDILHCDRITALLSATMLDSCTCLGSLGNMPINMMVVMAPEEPMSTIISAYLSDINFLVFKAIKGHLTLGQNYSIIVNNAR